MTQFGKAYLIAPVVYIGVIAGLLFLQFSGGERLTRSIGQLTLLATRTTTTEEGGPEVRSLELGFGGLTFAFGEESGLIVERRGSLADMRVLSFRTVDSGFQVEFEEGYRLSYLTSETPARELQIRLAVPDAVRDLVQVSIPFGIPAEAKVEAAAAGREGTTFVVVTVRDEEYYFSAPPQAAIDLVNRKLVLRPASVGQAIRYVRAAGTDVRTVTRWFEEPAAAVSDALHAERIRAFVDAAYAGWSAGRYNAASLTWAGPEGFRSFSEEALTAYLAEAWRRGEYDRAYAEMRRAVDLHPDRLGLLSSAFLGNLRTVRGVYLERDRERAGQIGQLLESRDPTLFRQEDLFSFAALRGSEQLYAGILQFAREVDLRTVDIATAAGMLANAFLYAHPDARATEASARFLDLVQLTVLPAITRVEDRHFVQSAPGQIDVLLTALTGAALDRAGSARRDSLVATMGRNLVGSALELADRNGMMPATLLVRGESVEEVGGAVAPEALYPLIAPAPYYPRMIPLYRERGSGHWIWSAVDVRTVRVTEREWRFELSYPRRRTFYLILQGVPVFTRMELFGQTWRDAPDFEIYSKGRHYVAQSDTLLIKYSDDSETREFVLFF